MPYVMNRKLGVIAMLISATGMGLVGTFSRGATAGLSEGGRQTIGAFLALGRMSLGFIGFLILAAMTKKLRDVTALRPSFSVIMGGVTIGLSLGFYISSTLMTSIANAVFLIYTGPLFCAILARIFRKEKISPFQAACLSLVFIGMLMTIEVLRFEGGVPTLGLDLDAATPEFPQKALGDIYGLTSGVFYGLSMFFLGYRKDIDSTVRGVWNFIFASVAALCMSLVLSPWEGVAQFTPVNWLWAFGLFFFCGLVALGFLVVAGRNLPAADYATVAYWECVVAIVCGVLIFGEAMTGTGIVGGILIIVGGMGPAFSSRLPSRRRGVQVA